jgi:hypothetical protein
MIFVIKKDLIALSIEKLRAKKTHSLFAGYLHLQQRFAQLNRLDDLRPDFLQFYKNFFFIANHPLGTPYIKLFTEQKPSQKNFWLNNNVAGSYAPSSLRANQPFRKVVDIAEKKYSLPLDHHVRAFEHLLYEDKVSAVHLSIVLYRNYGFQGQKIEISDIIDTFLYEFGYSKNFKDAPDESFFTLFDTKIDESVLGDIFESYNE